MKRILSYLVIAAIAISAAKATDSNDSVKLPETITFNHGGYDRFTLNADGYDKYEYDAQNRITKISSYDEDGGQSHTQTLTYVGDDLVKYVHARYIREEPEFLVTATEVYAKSGDQITVTYYDGTGVERGTTILDITNGEYISKWLPMFIDYAAEISYQYHNGNITKATHRYVEEWNGITITERSWEEAYEYDNNKSPFVNCKTPKWYLLYRHPLLFSGQNNRVVEKEGYVIQYEYDSDGYPTKCTFTMRIYDESDTDFGVRQAVQVIDIQYK